MNFDEFWEGFSNPKSELAKAMKFKGSVPAHLVGEDQAEWLFEVMTANNQESIPLEDRDPLVECCYEELKMFYSLVVNHLEDENHRTEQSLQEFGMRGRND